MSEASSNPTLGIAQALPCGKAGAAESVSAGADLHRIDIDLSNYPDAVCNDGTPATMFVRRYANEQDRNNWVIFLLGGGDCGRGQSCADRWCGISTNYGADKMSTSFLTEQSIVGSGIFTRPSPENEFAGWNQVFVYYCSSDNWQGHVSNVPLSATLPNGDLIDYLINFRGSDIVDAVIGTLQLQPSQSPVRYENSDGIERVMPDLNDAEVVLFTGSSAGGNGVKNNLDRVGDLLRRTNKRCRDLSDCSLLYMGVIDANYPPSFRELDLTQATFCPPFCTYESFYKNEWNQVDLGTLHARGDESCVTWHQTHSPGTEWMCADPQHIVNNHLTTPFFIRQDLQDKTWINNLVSQELATPFQFGQIVNNQLSNIVFLDSFAEEGSVQSNGQILRAPGVFGPQCTQHYGLTDSTAFFNVTVTQLDRNYSYHDLLWNWMRDVSPQQVVKPFTQTGPAPDCQ